MLDQKVGGKLLSRKGFLRSSRGMSYVEVLIALTVMSIIVLLVPAVMLHGTKATNATTEKTVAESLTRTQIEYLKNCEYKVVELPPDGLGQGGNPGYATVPPPDATYYIDVAVVAIDPISYGRLDLTLKRDVGIQQITVKVYHLDKPFPPSTLTPTPVPTPLPTTYKPMLSTDFYKVER
jgi:type II secretory pathway pseudopilin PulG